MQNLQELEKIINYTFKDKNLLLMAVTHSSYGNEHNLPNYQRLEFLGDSILNFVVAEYLFLKYPKKDEGVLSQARAKLVSKKPLSKIIKKLQIYQFMTINEGSIAEVSEKMISDLFESLTGAIYLDSGLKNAKGFILKFLAEELDNIEKQQAVDYKSKIYEFCTLKNKEICFKEASRNGEPHKPTFNYNLIIDGEVVAEATGSSIKNAEKECAKIACEKFKIV
ncbi:MAG: ribonuclease III [Clostridia bacterium]